MNFSLPGVDLNISIGLVATAINQTALTYEPPVRIGNVTVSSSDEKKELRL